MENNTQQFFTKIAIILIVYTLYIREDNYEQS